MASVKDGLTDAELDEPMTGRTQWERLRDKTVDIPLPRQAFHQNGPDGRLPNKMDGRLLDLFAEHASNKLMAAGVASVEIVQAGFVRAPDADWWSMEADYLLQCSAGTRMRLADGERRREMADHVSNAMAGLGIEPLPFRPRALDKEAAGSSLVRHSMGGGRETWALRVRVPVKSEWIGCDREANEVSFADFG